jgi:nucleotide-binding universal stress UspA family protein
VLLPLDSQDVSTTVADWTSTLAERFGAHVALVHVEAPPGAAQRVRARHSARRRTSTITTWNRIARELPPQRVFVDAVLGDPAEAVLSEARRFRSELVMLEAPDDEEMESEPSSVDSVLVQSHCPVLVIPISDEAP